MIVDGVDPLIVLNLFLFLLSSPSVCFCRPSFYGLILLNEHTRGNISRDSKFDVQLLQGFSYYILVKPDFPRLATVL